MKRKALSKTISKTQIAVAARKAANTVTNYSSMEHTTQAAIIADLARIHQIPQDRIREELTRLNPRKRKDVSFKAAHFRDLINLKLKELGDRITEHQRQDVRRYLTNLWNKSKKIPTLEELERIFPFVKS